MPVFLTRLGAPGKWEDGLPLCVCLISLRVSYSPGLCLSICSSLCLSCLPCSFLCCSALIFSSGTIASFRKSTETFGLDSGPSSVLLSHPAHQRDVVTALSPYQTMTPGEKGLNLTYLLGITPHQFKAQADRYLINIYWMNKGCSFQMFFFPNFCISLPPFSLLLPHHNQPNIALYWEI